LGHGGTELLTRQLRELGACVLHLQSVHKPRMSEFE